VTVHRRRVIVLVAGALATLSLFVSVRAIGSTGQQTADIWPNPAVLGDQAVPTSTDLPVDVSDGPYGGRLI
jgi:hypothetical protein